VKVLLIPLVMLILPLAGQAKADKLAMKKEKISKRIEGRIQKISGKEQNEKTAQRLSALNDFKSCVDGATEMSAIKSCREAKKSAMSGLRGMGKGKKGMGKGKDKMLKEQ